MTGEMTFAFCDRDHDLIAIIRLKLDLRFSEYKFDKLPPSRKVSCSRERDRPAHDLRFFSLAKLMRFSAHNSFSSSISLHSSS